MDIKNYVIQMRRTIHQNPELGFEEFETQELIIKELEAMNVKYSVMPTKTGVIAELGDIDEVENIIMLRADMDALPMTEESNKEYCSKNKGKMHACGHDSHVAVMLGVVKVLSKVKLVGRLRVLFQPNEEGIGGAKFMVDNNVLHPRPKAIFGFHVKPDIKTGVLGLKSGPIMAAVDEIDLKLIGKGGHAAMPEKTPDIILVAANIIQKIYQIEKGDSILTLCQVTAGTAFNIMPKYLTIKGTIRTLNNDVRKKIQQTIRKIIDEETEKIDFNLEIRNMAELVTNDEKLFDKCLEVAKVNDLEYLALEKACMGGEDFAEYLEYVPGCYIHLGTGNKDKGIIEEWHNPKFDIDEDALEVGVEFFCHLVKNMLS
ncbi:MAG: amidohydrolase [bacterium]|nr:amidohydrolase [bacterium]